MTTSCLYRCLHDFVPHAGAAVTRLMFCDNHLSQDPSNQYWRFLITAAKNNTELKIWCAVNWKCLQTIRFVQYDVCVFDDLIIYDITGDMHIGLPCISACRLF